LQTILETKVTEHFKSSLSKQEISRNLDDEIDREIARLNHSEKENVQDQVSHENT